MNFDTAFDRIVGHEGGLTDDPHDPGGLTNWGISQRSYPNVDIRNLTREQAKAIYKRDYWDAIKGDDMPAMLAFQVFDLAVNSGIGRARELSERAFDLGGGDELLIAVALNAVRLDYMTRLGGWPTFSRGWARRISNNLLYLVKDEVQDRTDNL